MKSSLSLAGCTVLLGHLAAGSITVWWRGHPVLVRRGSALAGVGACLAIAALLVAVHQVASSAVQQGAALRDLRAVQLEQSWRCSALAEPGLHETCMVAGLPAPSRPPH